MLTVSAPGKLILLGEHAVVYNYPCLVTAVDKRLYLSLQKTSAPKITIHAPAVNVKNYSFSLSEKWLNCKKTNPVHLPKKIHFITTAIKNFHHLYPLKNGFHISTKNSFSIKYGLGSSAAVTVATIFALSKFYRCRLSKKQIFALSYKTILDIQKVGSGFDAAAAVYGKTIYFLTAGKKILPLKTKKIPLIIGYSGTKAHTPALIKKVAQKKRKNPETISRIFNQIFFLVKKAKTALEKNDYQKLGDYFDKNQKLLQKLNVSSKKLNNLISAAKKNGAYGAKLSGAGGGDCMIALAPNNKIKNVKKAIISAGGKIINLQTNAQGVKVS